MVRGYVGTKKVPTGSGKTLSMMYDIRKELLKKRGKLNYKIVSNTDFELKETSGFFKKQLVEYKAEVTKKKSEFFEKMLSYRDTIFLIDEISVWADAREWATFPREIKHRLKQFRKVNIHLIYTSQFQRIVDKRLQEFTDHYVECSPFPKPNIKSFEPPPSPWLLKRKWVTPEYFEPDYQKLLINPQKDIRKAAEEALIYDTETIRLSELKRTFPTFDTYEITDFE